MAKLIQLKICNSADHAIQSGKWKNPGASFYDKLLNAFYCDGDIPIDPKDLEKKYQEGNYLQWNDFLKEAYLVAPIKNIKNSPYGVTPYSRSGCKYPHHVIRNGELVVSIPGLNAAYARAKQMGVFSGEVKKHLERHYKELGIYEDSTMKIQERIEQNFRDIEHAIYEQTGIDLHCSSTLYEEDIDNGFIRPLLLSDVTNPYFVEWLFRSYEFSDDDPERFNYDMLVNNDSIGNYTYGYFVNDKLEGIIKVKHHQPEDYYAISMLFVNDQNESNGIGQTLMKYIINKFGDKEMRLNVFAFNARAIHIYKKYGFDIAQTVVTKPEADGSESKLTGIEMHKMVRKPQKEYNTYMDFKPSIADIVDSASSNSPGEGSIKFASIQDIKEQYCSESVRNMEEEDNLDWITNYLMEDVEQSSDEETTEKPSEEKESMPKKTDKAESSKNGVRRKQLYITFIEWCKEYNNKNTFGSIFDKDAFNVSYPFVPEEMRYFYRLANPMLCVLAGELTFFAASELRKLNAKNSHLNEMMIFAATPNDVRVFNVKDKKVYLGTEENGAVKLGVVLGDTFDTYIQKMINKGDILNAPLAESIEFEDE